MRRLIITVFISLLSAVASADVPADPGNSQLSVFDGAINTVVADSMTPGSPVYKIAWSLWTFFAFLLFFKVISTWVLKPRSVDLADVLGSVVTIMVTVVLMNAYNTLTSGFWGLSDAIGFGIQEVALGNSDPFFMAGYVHYAFSMVDLGTVSFWDAVGTVFWYFIFIALSAALQLVMYIGTAWAMWGYALCKLIGFVFVPFFLLETTRKIFDGWFRLFVGFMLYNILVRTTMVLFCILIKETLGHPETPIVMEASSTPEFITLLVFMLTGILLLMSVSGFASIMAGGFTSPSAAYGAITRYAGQVVTAK